MDEHKRREMDKMNDMFGMPYSISVEDQPYPVLCIMLRKIHDIRGNCTATHAESLNEIIDIALFTFSIPQLCGNYAPLGFPAMPGLVAAPAHIGTADIQNRIRLQFAQYCIVAFPIVNLLFAVFALTAGTVKPEAENISVVCCKLGQLGNEIIIIRFSLPIA